MPTSEQPHTFQLFFKKSSSRLNRYALNVSANLDGLCSYCLSRDTLLIRTIKNWLFSKKVRELFLHMKMITRGGMWHGVKLPLNGNKGEWQLCCLKGRSIRWHSRAPWLVNSQREKAYSSSFYKNQLCFPVIKKTAVSMSPPMLVLLDHSQHKVEVRHCVL